MRHLLPLLLALTSCTTVTNYYGGDGAQMAPDLGEGAAMVTVDMAGADLQRAVDLAPAGDMTAFGALGDPCYPGGACYAGLTCYGADALNQEPRTCQACGQYNETCCPGGFCAGGRSCALPGSAFEGKCE